MTEFVKVVRQAYREILERDPDPSGLAHWNGRLQTGLSEAELRETLIRSQEFADKNPSAPVVIPNPGPGPITAPLQIQGNRFVPALRGATGCWGDDAPPPNSAGTGWPLAAPEHVDAFAAAHFNVTEVRTGPFVDDGWDLLRRRLRPSVQYANSKGLYVIVDLVDHWALANATNLYGDTCAVTHDAPPDRYLRWVDEVVNATGDLHVLYNLGNEGFRCQPSRSWEQGLYDRAKAMLSARGFPDRPVGSTFRVNQITGRKVFDCIFVHGWLIPIALDRPTILIETDNQHHTALEYRALIENAEALGTYVCAWRGPVVNEQWGRFLEFYGGDLPVVSPAGPVSIVMSPELVAAARWTEATDSLGASLAPQVAAAVDRVVQRNPWLFSVQPDGRTTLDGYGDPARDVVLRSDFWSLLQGELQPRPTIVSDQTAPLGNEDEIHVFRQLARSPEATAGIVEGYHLIAFGSGEVRRGEAIGRTAGSGSGGAFKGLLLFEQGA